MTILILVEHSKGSILGSTKEAVKAGKELASKLEESVNAVIIGYHVSEVAEETSNFVDGKVYVVDDEKLEIPSVLGTARALCDVITKNGSQIVLSGESILNTEVLPRAAVRLNGSYLPGCKVIDVQNNILTAERSLFEDKLTNRIQGTLEKVNIATLAPGVYSPAEPEDTGTTEIVDVPLSLEEGDLRENTIEEKAAERAVDISKAKIVVSGGRGVGSKEKFEIIFKFKEFLGGSPNVEVGASRMAVDADWVAYDHEVGQTGTVVSPDIYIASGISGAFQHVVGMKNSKVVIAINTDPEAPIWDVSTYGIVGDLHEVIPKLMEKLG